MISHKIFALLFSFLSSCGGTTFTSCCLVIRLSDVLKRRSYHRVLKLHVGCDPGQALSVEILQPVQYGNGRAEGEDRTYLDSRARAFRGEHAAILMLDLV